MKRFAILALLAALMLSPFAASAAKPDAVMTKIADLQTRWAQIKYDTKGKDAQIDAAKQLAADAGALAAQYPDRAEPKVQQAIALATQANFNRSLSSLPLVKQAKGLLEQAIAIDGRVMDAAAYTYLGSLYAQVPGWPISFGDSDKAEANFKKALELAPANIDAHYFYGEYLLDHNKPEDARAELQKALAAPDRPGRKRADEGRRDEIRQLIAKAEMKEKRPAGTTNN